MHLPGDALIPGWLWGGQWWSTGNVVFLVALKPVEADTWKAHLSAHRTLPLPPLPTPVPGQGEGLPHWEPDLLVKTGILWERDSCTLSASLGARAAADRKHTSVEYVWQAPPVSMVTK